MPITLNIQIEGLNEAQAQLAHLAGPEALKTALEAGGQETRVQLLHHFRERAREPEKTVGFPKFGQSFGKRGFWAGTGGNSVAEKVGPGALDVDGQSFIIPIASRPLAHKADPSPPPITPKGDRRYLAIPANARAAAWAGMPSDFPIPGGMKFGYAPTPEGRWMKALVARENHLRTITRGKHAGQRVLAAANRGTHGAAMPQYWLVKSVQTPHDPRALPDAALLAQKAAARAEWALQRLAETQNNGSN